MNFFDLKYNLNFFEYWFEHYQMVDYQIVDCYILSFLIVLYFYFLDFQIEKFKWNSWISVGQVRGKGGSAQNQYSFNLPLHSGKNKVRISQIDNTGKTRSSKALEYPSKIAPFTMGPSSVRDYLYFYSNNKKSKTRFEVLDAYGNLLKAGYANNVDCKNIVNGIYYINYDNTTDKFIKVNKNFSQKIISTHYNKKT